MKIMTEKEWYASDEHFNTEYSYKKYLNKMKEIKKMKDPLKNTEPKGAMK